jgi:hypothetical protein
MKRARAVLLAWIVMACWAAVSAAQTPGTPMYTNARVVSINPLERTLVIRQADGTQQTVQLDETVGGLGDVRAGDEVLLGLRAQPGWPRVTMITKSKASTTTRGTPAPRALPPAASETSQTAIDAFTRQVASLSQDADRVDRLWSAFRTTCDATVGSEYEGGREWFGLWTNDVRADLSNGTCRDLYNQIIGLGETVVRAMAGAEDAARRSLSPGDVREVRLRYSMDWDGWTLPAPERQRL